MIKNHNKSKGFANSVLSQEQIKIKLFCKKRNIEWLCHFTPRSNLESIKRNGLVPRNKIKGQFKPTDNYRFDGHQDTICLSISAPNKWMFQKKQKENLDLCLLLINPDILFLKKCAFYPHNAATASYRNIPLSELMGYKAIEALFSDTITYQRSGLMPESHHRNQFLNIAETTSNQAEVQCYDAIEPYFIEYILEEDIPLDYQGLLNYVGDVDKRNELSIPFVKSGSIGGDHEARNDIDEVLELFSGKNKSNKARSDVFASNSSLKPTGHSSVYRKLIEIQQNLNEENNKVLSESRKFLSEAKVKVTPVENDGTGGDHSARSDMEKEVLELFFDKSKSNKDRSDVAATNTSLKSTDSNSVLRNMIEKQQKLNKEKLNKLFPEASVKESSTQSSGLNVSDFNDSILDEKKVSSLSSDELKHYEKYTSNKTESKDEKNISLNNPKKNSRTTYSRTNNYSSSDDGCGCLVLIVIAILFSIIFF